MMATLQARIVAALAALLISGGLLAWVYHAGYSAGGDSVRAEWVRDIEARDKHTQERIAQHDTDQSTINGLRAELERVRIHLPTCPAASGQDVRGRAFSESLDASFARLQQRAGALFTECDQLNIDAIRAKEGK